MSISRDRIKGMFRGVAIGDALGAPCETFSVQKIAKVFGRITEYKPLDGHKWFDGHPIGTITDDTALTIATAEGIIEGNGIDMDAIAKHHVVYLADPIGMGGSTKDALKKLKKGISWKESGKTDKPQRGTGNGIAMKVGPIAAWCAVKNENPSDYMVNFGGMTHYTDIGIVSGDVMAWAFVYCLKTDSFDRFKFLSTINSACKTGQERCEKIEDLPKNPDLLGNAIAMLGQDRFDNDPGNIIAEFGGGSCYVFNSLPFSLAFFLRDPSSIETLYDVASAGGDVDSNASMVAALQGCLHGSEFFPDHLLQGLPCLSKIDDLAERFCDTAGLG